MGALVPLLETTWPWSDLSARPCLASAASELHFSPGSPEETPLHTMLFLPAAALCWLGSALAAMATQLVQDQVSLVANAGSTVPVLLKCSGTDTCDAKQVYWYRTTERDPLTAILLFNLTNQKVINLLNFNDPLRKDFTVLHEQNGCNLMIQEVKTDHSGSYYCVCWMSGGSGGSSESKYLVFGTGTKLYVTDSSDARKRKDPEVSLYSAVSGLQPDRKEPLLCVASGMFPPVIRFTWKRKKEDGKEEVLPAGAEQLEIRESDRFSSIRMVDPDPQHTYEYRCSVQHEGSAKESPSQKVAPRPAGPPPPTESLGFSQQLLFLIYSLLIAKSLLYFCGLSLISVCGTSRAD